MKIYLTSDTHFFHENIIIYCNRPFSSWEEMNGKIAERWNKRVSKEDIIAHFGDFSLGGPQETIDIAKSLNGHIILIKGNHDRRTRTFWEDRAGFVKYFKKDIIISDNVVLSHRPKWIEGVVNLHGHLHNSLGPYHSESCVNLSTDVWEFYPVNLNNIKFLSSNDRKNIEDFFINLINC